MAAAARRELARRDPEAVAVASARSEQRFRTAGSFDAAELGGRDQLSSYDAPCAGAAKELGIPLVSTDAKLLSAGLAEPPTAVVQRLRLPH
ncbi:MAG: hypothetical protein ACP5VR_10625 [Acidimicrobiales bacterium]